MKSKLTEKYGNALLFVTVDQNRSIIVISLASVENQPVSNFVDKTNILKQAAAILKEDANIFVEKTDVPWQPTINLLDKDSRLFEITVNFYQHCTKKEVFH